MEFIGYETCSKLIWKLSKGCRNKNEISKQGNPKSDINKIYPSPKLGFGLSHIRKDISSDYLISCRLQSYSSKN